MPVWGRGRRPRATGPGFTPRARVSLVTRSGCHLCDEARAVIESVAADLDVSWEEVSVEGDADLLAAYGEQVPVTFVDGRQHDYWRVDEARLRRALGTRDRS